MTSPPRCVRPECTRRFARNRSHRYSTAHTSHRRRPEPGDTLEVRILQIQYAIPYAYNSFSPRSGVLTAEDFPKGATRIIPLDTKRNLAHFSDRIEIPLRPFFGSMGVAPPEAAGRVSSAP